MKEQRVADFEGSFERFQIGIRYEFLAKKAAILRYFCLDCRMEGYYSLLFFSPAKRC